jgi:hypothetical protein
LEAPKNNIKIYHRNRTSDNEYLREVDPVFCIITGVNASGVELRFLISLDRIVCVGNHEFEICENSTEFLV